MRKTKLQDLIMRKVKLDCYTFDETLLEMLPLKTKATKPAWWSGLKKLYKVFDVMSGIEIPTPTIKLCPGVVDYIRNPIEVKLWTDVIFKVFPSGKVTTVCPLNEKHALSAGVHDEKQTGPDLYPGRTVVKLSNPWALKASDRSQFMCTEVHYSEDLRKHNIIVSPGILNFYDQHALNIFLAFPLKDEPYEIELKYGTPIMALHSMTEKPIEIECHLTNIEGLNRILAAFPSTFFGRYYARRKSKGNI